MSTPCLLTPHAYSSSTCGYCSPSGSRSDRSTSKKYGLEATQMSAHFYQDMIDRGWRRSGDYVYRPDMARTCCPQYTIRLDALGFKPNKKHRQVMNRFNRFLETGEKPGDDAGGSGGDTTRGNDGGNSKSRGKGKGKGKAKEETWVHTLRLYQKGKGQDTASSPLRHRFETELTPAKTTPETFELYRKYQVSVHNDKLDKVTMRGFSRFLCDSPLGAIKYKDSQLEDSSLPQHFGSYHLLYKVDGKAIGISVIDILPNCISSVYFIWHPDWAWASLGKLSALHEIALSVDMNRAGVDSMKYLYMGYWISNCVKMRYKSEYSPSYLLDPGTLRFHLLDSQLDKYLQAHPTGYHPFTNIPTTLHPPDVKLTGTKVDHSARAEGSDTAADSDDDDDEGMEELDEFPSPAPPGFADPASFTDRQLEELLVLMKSRGIMGMGGKSRVVPLGALEFGQPDRVLKLVREMVAAVGLDLMASGKSLDKMKNKGILFFG